MFESNYPFRIVRGELRNMKGPSIKKFDEMRVEYQREDMRKRVRGKHFSAYRKGSNLALLAPPLAKIPPQ